MNFETLVFCIWNATAITGAFRVQASISYLWINVYSFFVALILDTRCIYLLTKYFPAAIL
ncbi:MAG: hypothetical protein K0S04_2896 [Herbinix sp.]|jgi:hypothetical protein|nr:hypothetical protein [Herbinix sp.]